MITLVTLKDEMVDGKRRAAGRQIRKIVAICVDNYNIVLAEGVDPDKLIGKKFGARLRHIVPYIVAEYEISEAQARRQMIAFWAKFSGESVGDLGWDEMDKRFEVAKRRKDSSGILVLYDTLKEKGWADNEAQAQAA